MNQRRLALSFALLLLLAVSVNFIEGSALNETSISQDAVPVPAAAAAAVAKQKTARSGGDVTYTASYSVVRSALKRGKTMVMSVPVPNKPAPVHIAENTKDA